MGADAGRSNASEKVVNTTAAMVKMLAISWTQLSVGCVLLLQLALLCHGDSASSSSSSQQNQPTYDDDLSSVPANCTPREVSRRSPFTST